MSTPAVTGSCLCGAVKFEVVPPFAAFRYCYCSRCRKASGSAHAANAFVPVSQFRWLAGEATLRAFDLPGAKRFGVHFCPTCGTRMPHKVKTTENMLIPAGCFDGDPGARPESSIFWQSRAPWYRPAQDMPCFDEYA